MDLFTYDTCRDLNLELYLLPSPYTLPYEWNEELTEWDWRSSRLNHWRSDMLPTFDPSYLPTFETKPWKTRSQPIELSWPFKLYPAFWELMVPKAGDNSSGLRPSLPTFYHIDCARVPRITQIIPNARKTEVQIRCKSGSCFPVAKCNFMYGEPTSRRGNSLSCSRETIKSQYGC